MQPQESLFHPKYRPDIDGLRAIAVLSVVIYHASPRLLKGGFIGVDIFFVISGFLISTIIFESLDRNAFSFRTFYARRILRIFPALIIVLSATLAFGWLALLSDELSQLGRHTLAGAGFMSNFVLWNEVGYFDTAAETKPLLHLWSLSIEEQFYILWPLMLWLMWRWKESLPLFIAALIVLSFTVNIVMVANNPVGAFYSPVSRFWELLCGAFLAWCFLRKAEYAARFSKYSRIGRGDQDAWKMLPDAASACGILLIGYGLFEIEKDHGFPGYWALLPVVGTVLVIAAGPAAWINRRILSSPLFVWFGLISFPLYLWHWPLLSYSQIILSESPSHLLKVILVLLAIVLSWLTVMVIERPIRVSQHHRTLKVVSLTFCMLCIGFVGLAVSRTDFSETHRIDMLVVPRPEHVVGSSLSWYHGEEDWLYLGNAYDDSVAKLKLAMRPTEDEIAAVRKGFAEAAAAAARSGTAVALLVGPNKETIYPEFLPEGLTPSPIRYSSFFLDSLRSVPGLVLYDPTEDLLRLKGTEGLLYWRTDTHWNLKGAYFALVGILDALDLPAPDLAFEMGPPHGGDLIERSGIKDFPLHADDNWEPVWPEAPAWTTTTDANTPNPIFVRETVHNERSLTELTVWVVGDSFAAPMRPYLNATFRDVIYVGHWRETMADLPGMLEKADEKPDLILFVRVERSF